MRFKVRVRVRVRIDNLKNIFKIFDRWRCKHVGHSLSLDACLPRLLAGFQMADLRQGKRGRKGEEREGGKGKGIRKGRERPPTFFAILPLPLTSSWC